MTQSNWIHMVYGSDLTAVKREKLKKKTKTENFKERFSFLPVQSLIIDRYPVEFTYFFWNFTEKVQSIWKWANLVLLAPFVKAILSGCGAFKSRETPLREKNVITLTLNSYYIHPCSCFHFIMNEISWNIYIKKNKNAIRDVWPRWRIDPHEKVARKRTEVSRFGNALHALTVETPFRKPYHIQVFA